MCYLLIGHNGDQGVQGNIKGTSGRDGKQGPTLAKIGVVEEGVYQITMRRQLIQSGKGGIKGSLLN